MISCLGDNCTIPTSLYRDPKRALIPEKIGNTNGLTPAGSEPGTIAGIVIVIILGGIILFIVVYCKFYRKFKRLKSELAHVHYVADPHVRPGNEFSRLANLSYERVFPIFLLEC